MLKFDALYSFVPTQVTSSVVLPAIVFLLNKTGGGDGLFMLAQLFE